MQRSNFVRILHERMRQCSSRSRPLVVSPRRLESHEKLSIWPWADGAYV
jgi:hypothetical protein